MIGPVKGDEMDAAGAVGRLGGAAGGLPAAGVGEPAGAGALYGPGGGADGPVPVLSAPGGGGRQADHRQHRQQLCPHEDYAPAGEEKIRAGPSRLPFDDLYAEAEPPHRRHPAADPRPDGRGGDPGAVRPVPPVLPGDGGGLSPVHPLPSGAVRAGGRPPGRRGVRHPLQGPERIPDLRRAKGGVKPCEKSAKKPRRVLRRARREIKSNRFSGGVYV